MGHFYFARHGQTVWNVENKICGATDIELTELGHQQAEELVVKSGLIEPTYVEEAPTYVKKYVKNYFVSTVGQVDFS